MDDAYRAGQLQAMQLDKRTGYLTSIVVGIGVTFALHSSEIRHADDEADDC
jgi:hypothetical protein